MAKTGQRFYLPHYAADHSPEVVWEDVGHLLNRASSLRVPASPCLRVSAVLVVPASSNGTALRTFPLLTVEKSVDNLHTFK